MTHNRIVVILLVFFNVSLTVSGNVFDNVNCGDSNNLSVRLFASSKPRAVIFRVERGGYKMQMPGQPVRTIKAGDIVLIFRYHDALAVKTTGSEGVVTPFVSLIGVGDALFSLSTKGAERERRVYDDDLTCIVDAGLFFIINETTIEKYLPGVVQSEGGNGREREFFKAQAVIARTYAWKNIMKHSADGYDLCDDTHCQAFYGRSSNPLIREAVEDTRGLVISDRDSLIIDALFHSNCGGETVSSADTWLSGRPYLVSVTDTFCTSSRNALWREKIPVERWQMWLIESGYKGDINDQALFSFSQKSRRTHYSPVEGLRIAVTDIRSYYGLRSAFFSLTRKGDNLCFEGRGYGHGVGLCQEGAMAMAALGYTFSEILDFYYRDTIIIPVTESEREAVLHY